jgi:hypothetical protein
LALTQQPLLHQVLSLRLVLPEWISLECLRHKFLTPQVVVLLHRNLGFQIRTQKALQYLHLLLEISSLLPLPIFLILGHFRLLVELS